MSQELIAKIDHYQAKYDTLDKSTVAGQNQAQPLLGIIAALKAQLPAPEVKLHVAQGSTCESCEG